MDVLVYLIGCCVRSACIIALVGTKLDLINNGANRGVQPGVVKKYAASINAKTFETSAKDDSAGGDKISEPFEVEFFFSEGKGKKRKKRNEWDLNPILFTFFCFPPAARCPL